MKQPSLVLTLDTFLNNVGRLTVLALLLATAVAAQNAAAPQSVATAEPAIATTETESATVEELGQWRLGSGDLLDVSVYGVPELSQQIRVNSSGDIYLPLIGYLGVEGLTVSEAQQLIEKRLTDGGFLKNPHVALFVKEYATSGISVLGEVTRPGIYPLLGSHRLFDALAAAGGTSTRAGKTVSITRRRRPNEPITVTLSRDPQKSAASNTAIYPGDTIVVSRAGVIYVVGEVQKPKGILMEDNERLTVLQALAIAEGAKPYAALDGSKLIRKTEGGHQEIPLPLKKMLQAKAPDVALQAEDILFVPASAGKNVAVKSLNAIIQVATGIAIYGSR